MDTLINIFEINLLLGTSLERPLLVESVLH